MLYYLYEYLTNHGIHIPGLKLTEIHLFPSWNGGVYCPCLLPWFTVKKSSIILRTKQMGELVRDLGLEGQKQKEGTPTMGGLIIIFATIIPVLLFTRIYQCLYCFAYWFQ